MAASLRDLLDTEGVELVFGRVPCPILLTLDALHCGGFGLRLGWGLDAHSAFVAVDVAYGDFVESPWVGVRGSLLIPFSAWN
jgi:hypothetical protein